MRFSMRSRVGCGGKAAKANSVTNRHMIKSSTALHSAAHGHAKLLPIGQEMCDYAAAASAP